MAACRLEKRSQEQNPKIYEHELVMILALGRRIARRLSVQLATASFLILIVPATRAMAHAVCGDRVFPATLTMDDPGVGDELSLPTIQYTSIPESGGHRSGRSVSYGYEWDKTITPNFGFAINGDYQTQHGGDQNLSGWDNISVTLKDRILCIPRAEFMMSVGIVREFARTGSSRLAKSGVIDTVSNTAPTVYFGAGLGEFHIGYLRPFAVTGELAYQLSDSPSVSPDQWSYAASVQYSMPYLQHQVKALDIPDFFTRLIPLVEVSLSSPKGGPTTGTVSPGVLYEADKWQFGAEAMLPANAATRQTQGIGFIVQFHLFLDDALPKSLGRPLLRG